MDGVSIIITQGGRGFDISGLVENVQWQGRKGSSARSVSVAILDDDGYAHERAGIDVEQGQQCIFSYSGQELFRGMIMSMSQGDGKSLSFTAYDNGICLANNEDTFRYTNKTASYIFKDCCRRFGIPFLDVSETSYRIPELVKVGTTAFDAMSEALSLDYKATGIRHFIISKNGSLSLLTRRENILQWVIETGANIISYNYASSIEGIKTRIKMLSKDGDSIAEKADAGLEKKYGIFQGVESRDDALSTGQLNDLAGTILKEKSIPEKTISVEALGIPDVISGIGVFVIIPHLGISRTFYVDDDTHTFSGRSHTMRLKLNFASDLETEPAGQKNMDASYEKGRIVQFNGGSHYISSNAPAASGGSRKSGKAEITLVAKGAKHPYHIIGGAYSSLGGSCNAYGWVDAGSFSEAGI